MSYDAPAPRFSFCFVPGGSPLQDNDFKDSFGFSPCYILWIIAILYSVRTLSQTKTAAARACAALRGLELFPNTCRKAFAFLFWD